MGYHTACPVRTRRRRVPLARPVGICDGWRVGEVPERPKGHAWRACVPTRYRGFESLPLRLTKLIWGARPLLACASRTLRIRTPARFRGAPQTPPAGAAPLGAGLPLPCASRPRRLLYGSPRGRWAVAARSCARRRREPRQVRKEAAVPNVLLCRRAP